MAGLRRGVRAARASAWNGPGRSEACRRRARAVRPPRRTTISTTWTSTSSTAQPHRPFTTGGDPGPEHVAGVDRRRRSALEYADGLQPRIVRPAEDHLVASLSAGQRGTAISYGRHNRWRYLGLVNEPCFKEATGPDPNRFGLWLDVRDPSCPPDPFADAQKYPGVKIGARGTTVARRLLLRRAHRRRRPAALSESGLRRERAARSGIRSGSTTIPATTTSRIWCVRTASACRAPSATSGPTRSSRRPIRKTRSGRT